MTSSYEERKKALDDITGIGPNFPMNSQPDIEKKMSKVNDMLNNPRTGLQDSSNSNKTRSAIIATLQEMYEMGREDAAHIPRRLAYETGAAYMKKRILENLGNGFTAKCHSLIHKKRHREVTLEDNAVVLCVKDVFRTIIESLPINPNE